MNNLSPEKRIEIVAALVDGLGVRATARITDTDRKTVARLALRVGRGCAVLHDGKMTGVRTSRIELDEVWAFIGQRRRREEKPRPDAQRGDAYTFVALASSARAIVSYLTGARTAHTTMEFAHDLRERVIGMPEISTDGYRPYEGAIRSAFGNRVAHGKIVKTYSVSNLAVKETARRYSPAEVVAVEREVVSGVPAKISTSLVERSHLTLRQTCKRFARLGNGFSKKLEPHCAAIALHVMHYNFCRSHESLKQTPAMALGLADHVWTIGELIDAALATQPIKPDTSAPDRRKRFTVIQGGKE